MREKQYRLFGKIGVLDIIIVVLVIAGIAAAFSYAANMDVSAAGQKTVEYGVYLAKKDADFENGLTIGMNVYDSLKGGKIGTLASYEKEPYSTLQPDTTTGEIIRSEVDGLYNYIIVISSPADISESAISVGSYEVAVGKEMFIKSKTFASQGFCVTLDIGGEG